MNTTLINRHVAAVAIRFGAYAAPIESIAKFVALSLGDEAPELPTLVHYLRKEETRELLASNYEVGLWCGPGDQWRLVSTSTPPTLEAIKYRLSAFPDSTGTQCAWCLIDEKSNHASELIVIRDLHNAPIHRRLVHRACYHPWMIMVSQAARAGVVTNE